MATQFNPADAVEQKPEVQEQPAYSIKVDGYDEVQDEKTDTGSPIEPNNLDQGGVESVLPDSAPAQELEEVSQKEETQESTPDLEVIDIDSDNTTNVSNPIEEPTTQVELPEIVQKFADFHKDTGGSAQDYLNYTKDYESLNDNTILAEYYKLTKPHYSESDINLLIQDKFGVTELDEGEEASHEDRLKMLAMKDELVEAKSFLNTNRDKYYVDLKSGVHGAPEQYKEAVDFYNKSQESAKATEEWRNNFINESQKVFSKDFQGFEFTAGDKSYRLKVGDVQKTMESQLDLNQVVGEFLDDNGNVADTKGYHKAIWAAKNIDKVFNAAFEQGKAEALKERAQATKNPEYRADAGQSQAPAKKAQYKFLGNEYTNNQY